MVSILFEFTEDHPTSAWDVLSDLPASHTKADCTPAIDVPPSTISPPAVPEENVTESYPKNDYGAVPFEPDGIFMLNIQASTPNDFLIFAY